MLEVVLTKIENAGKFLCRPKTSSDNGEHEYLEFVASLNTFYEKKRHDNTMFISNPGDLCACYTSVGEETQRVWYRGQIASWFQSKSGMIAKVLLVDEGDLVFVTKQRMRQLDKRFEGYPQQVMQCKLDGVSPISLAPNAEFVWSMRKANHWDCAATRFVEDITRDKGTWISQVGRDEDGISYLVNLYVKENKALTNVNDLLIQKEYATNPNNSKDVFSDVNLAERKLLEQLLDIKSTPENNESSTSVASLADFKREVLSSRSEDSTITYQPTSVSINSKSQSRIHKPQVTSVNQVWEKRMKTKREQERKFIEDGNKDCEELLKIIHGEDYVSSSSKKSDTSGTSDLSDMETTPVPKIESFKSHRPNQKTAAQFLTEKIGKESSDLFSELYDLEKDETSTPKSSKKVSFSPHNEVYNIKREQEIVPGKLLDFVEGSSGSIASDNLSSYFDDGFHMLQFLKSESRSLPSDSPILDDVVVYGKLQRKPNATLGELDLPPTMKPLLRNFNMSKPSPFQAHMWPAVSAFRNILGIAESSQSMRNEVLSYALPILRDIIDGQERYKKMGKGNGPYMMILVNSWREAQEVYDIFEKLTEYYKNTLRVDVRYGGMDKGPERDIRLVNGCEVLIATVPSVNRALELGYTNFSRLCHIIFENSDSLVEKFTEDIKVFMRSYTTFLKACKKPDLFNQQIISIGRKWSYGIRSLMTSYMNDPLVVINNKIEAALYAKIPIVVELCNANERLEYLVAFLETDAAQHNTIVATNSAKCADTLKENLLNYSQSVNAITEFTQAVELKDIKHQWDAHVGKASTNVLVISDNAIIKSGIRNASYVVHYDYPQKKSHFGNRLHCLSDTVRKNQNSKTPEKVVSHVFVTEKNNGMRYSTGLVKLLKRAGQDVPDLLTSMALSSREVSTVVSTSPLVFSNFVPSPILIKAFMDDCQERHTIFRNKDMLGLCPSTGFIKVLILDVISASNFWGRIVEHRLPYNKNGVSNYDTSTFMRLALDLQEFYRDSTRHKHCINVSIYDVRVTNTKLNGYQRVRIERMVKRDFERPKTLEVFGIDNGLTFTVRVQDLLECDEKFTKIPPQAVEIITCCIKPVEKGDSWTHEASMEMENRLIGKTLEGRIQFSLQNTIWVDPLVEKEVLLGMQTKTYSLDVGRDLIQMGYAEKNVKHVDNLRKLLYDVSGHPLEKKDDKKSLPATMLDHEASYLQDDDYEDVYISAVVNPGLFFVQRAENCEMIEKLDDKIDATMKVKKLDLDENVYPIGYICVAKFSVDNRWYRAKIVNVNEKEYEVFYVDHGDREWVNKKNVANSWNDILTPAYQAVECSFKGITPITNEWTEEDGDKYWDLVKDRLLVAKVLSTSSSEYLNESVHYEIELYDTTSDQNINICHQLVLMGIAKGEAYCLQEMFPQASIDTRGKIYDNQDEKQEKVSELHGIIISTTAADELWINGAVSSTCKLLALTREAKLQAKLLQCIAYWAGFGQEYCNGINDNDGIKTVCNILKRSMDENHQKAAIETLMLIASDSWYHDVLRESGFIKCACNILEASAPNSELLSCTLDALIMFCRNKEMSCDMFRQEDGLRALCRHFKDSKDQNILHKATELFRIVLSYWRNQEKMREIGGYQILSSLINKRLSNRSLENVLKTLIACTENNITNKTYLLMIKADQNIKKCSSLPLRYSMVVRSLFKELLQLLKPDRNINLMEKEILPIFREKIDVQKDDVIMETITPMTSWSQRRRTVTLAVRVRGAVSAEASVEGNKLHFRTVLHGVEYLLEIDLYAEANIQGKQPIVKGGEILIVLHKENNEIWPRLLETEEKHPCLSIDFDRWVEEFPAEDDTSYEDSTDVDGVILFKPGLPRPPPSKYSNGPVYVPTFETSSNSDDSENEYEDEDEEVRGNADYFNI